MEKQAKNAGLYNAARDYKPLQVTLGTGKVVVGFEEALIGMKMNEEKEVVIPPEKAYGKSGSHSMAGKTLQCKLRGAKSEKLARRCLWSITHFQYQRQLEPVDSDRSVASSC